MNAIVPISRTSITIRPGVLDDVPFLDSLQKLHTKQVGWLTTKALAGKVKLGHVLIAEEGPSTASASLAQAGSGQPAAPVGYCIGNDQYFKRDDVGIIVQLNVAPTRQRGLIGATLIKAMFDRAAYGCKLFCCWCAQDIEANYFWESLGFVPLAFRAGSRKKRRVHIFWQRRIRAGDTTTPWWFPSQTTSGSIREDRLVLPIPPGTHWRDAKPLVLPGQRDEGRGQNKALPAPRQKRRKDSPAIKPSQMPMGGLWFAVRQGSPQIAPTDEQKPKEKIKRSKTKNDPKLVAAARELRDRWLEQVNSGQYLPQAQGKYDVTRQIEEGNQRAMPLIAA